MSCSGGAYIDAAFLDTMIGKPVAQIQAAWGRPALEQKLSRADTQIVDHEWLYEFRSISFWHRRKIIPNNLLIIDTNNGTITFPTSYKIKQRGEEIYHRIKLQCPVKVAFDTKGIITGWKFVDPNCYTKIENPAKINISPDKMSNKENLSIRQKSALKAGL